MLETALLKTNVLRAHVILHSITALSFKWFIKCCSRRKPSSPSDMESITKCINQLWKCFCWLLFGKLTYKWLELHIPIAARWLRCGASCIRSSSVICYRITKREIDLLYLFAPKDFLVSEDITKPLGETQCLQHERPSHSKIFYLFKHFSVRLIQWSCKSESKPSLSVLQVKRF